VTSRLTHYECFTNKFFADFNEANDITGMSKRMLKHCITPTNKKHLVAYTISVTTDIQCKTGIKYSFLFQFN